MVMTNQVDILEKYGEMINLIPDIVCLTNKDHIITHCNERLLEQLGIERKEIIGTSGMNFLTKESQEKIIKIISQPKQRGRIENLEVDTIKKDGTIYKALVTIDPILDEKGEFQGAISVTKDITELYQIKKELYTQRERNLATIGHLSSRMAHDIKNPISVISMSLENLRGLYGVDKSKQKQFDKVERSIDFIVHQIDEVLNFVREQPIETSKIKVSEIIRESLDSIKISNEIKIILPKNDIEITCDKNQILICLNNLISNGIQAIDDKGEIQIRISEQNDNVIIQIQDSGKGISKENIEKIFEPLFTTKQKGTGLGLSSVVAIIDSHHGKISVTSPPTIFTITLPKTIEKT